MKLTHVQIRYFKHVLDSSEVAIQPDITCLVGKNESGKSAFLEALRRLKPSQGSAKFSSATHYPAWLEKRHRREAKAAGRDLDDAIPITAKFALENADKQAVADVFGDGVLLSKVFEVSREYNNKYSGIFQVDEQRAIANLLSNFNLTKSLASLKACKTFDALRAEIVKLTPTGDDSGAIKLTLDGISEAAKAAVPDDLTLSQAVWRVLFARVPSFFYFSEYSGLPSTVPIRKLLAAKEEDLDEQDQTALALLQLAAFEEDHFLDTSTRHESANWSTLPTSFGVRFWSIGLQIAICAWKWT